MTNYHCVFVVDTLCFQVCGIQVGLVRVMGQVKKCTFLEFALDFKLGILLYFL
jgi:hypothetical protein